MNLVAFDLETNASPMEWDRTSHMGITCAAIHIRVQTKESGLVQGSKLWCAGMSNPDNPLTTGVGEIAEAILSGEYKVENEMSEGEVELMLEELLALLDPNSDRAIPVEAKGRWPTLVTWNGVGFDFPAIVSNIPHRKDDIVNLMLDSIDPCFQFARRLGFPIGVDSIAQTMLGVGKPEGMDGAVAAESWPERAGEIIAYCYNDCVVTADVMDAVRAERQVRWITKTGKHSAKTAREFKVGSGWGKVNKVIELPEPNRKWMKDYKGEFDLWSYIDWTK
jgi:hypothetical protein